MNLYSLYILEPAWRLGSLNYLQNIIDFIIIYQNIILISGVIGISISSIIILSGKPSIKDVIRIGTQVAGGLAIADGALVAIDRIADLAGKITGSSSTDSSQTGTDSNNTGSSNNNNTNK